MSTLRSLVAAGFLASLASAQNAPLYLGAELLTSDTARFVASDDLNGDGNADLVASIWSGSETSLNVFLGLGSASFFPMAKYATSQAMNLVIADLNGDGALDVVTGMGVSIHPGNGFGILLPSVFVSNNMRWVAVGDMNGDGALDLVGVNPFSELAAILLNTGGLTYAPAVTFPAGPSSDTVELADFNEDGKLDAAVTTPGSSPFTSEIAILAGSGAGAFGAPSTVPVGTRPNRIAIADLNGDGHADLAVSAESSGDVSIRLGDGSGAFAAAPTLSGLTQPFAPRLRDLDGDGKLDLTVARQGGAHAYLGDGAGGFGAPKLTALSKNPVCIEVVDVTGEGKADLVTGHWSFKGNALAMAFGDGAGGFVRPPSFATGASPRAAVTGDWNGDGKLDVAVACASANAVSVLAGDGAGGFGPFSAVAVGNSPQSLATADFNLDGELDLVVANKSSNTASVLFGNGIGGFTTLGAFFLGSGPQKIVTGDWNEDGFTDVAVANPAVNSVTAALNNGSGVLGISGSHFLTGAPAAVAAGDVTGDGHADLVSVAFPPTGGFTVSAIFAGDGLGAFGVPTTATFGPYSENLALTDLNGDGRLDLVGSNTDFGIVVALGNALGGLTAFGDSPAGPTVSGFALGDADGDGRVDALVSCSEPNMVAVLLGTGTGTFLSSGVRYLVGDAPSAVALGDFDLDGKLDAVVPDANVNDLTFLRNQRLTPASIAPYGTGTAGCFGRMAMLTSSAPEVPNSTFTITCTNAPRSALGLALISDVQDAAGSEFLGLGFLLHVDLIHATFLTGLDFKSDPSGTARAPIPIPNAPSLANAVVYAQGLWVEPAALACGPSAFHFVTTNGVKLTILP